MRRTFIISALLLSMTGVRASVPEFAAADRFSADSLNRYIRNRSLSVRWDGTRDDKGRISDCRVLTYTLDTPDGRIYMAVDTRTWRKRRLFDNQRMAAELARFTDTGEAPAASDLRIWELQFDRRSTSDFTFRFNRRTLRYDSRSGRVTDVPDTPATNRQQSLMPRGDYRRSRSADSTLCISAVGHDLWLYSHPDAAGRYADSVRLTSDGERYRSFALGGTNRDLRPDELGSPCGYWMGDSHYFVAVREDKRKVGELTIVDALSQPRPTARSYKFAMPGDEHVTQYDAWIVDADSGCIRRLDIDRWKDQKIEIPRFGRIVHTNTHAYFIRRSRTCDSVDLCRIDFAAKKVEPIISEVCKPAQNDQQFNYRILNGGDEILWWSERSGRGHYYLYDGDGNLKRAVTSGDYTAGAIQRIDTLTRTMIYEGYGREQGVNPHYRMYYRCRLDGGEPVLLTPGNGDHSVEFSPDGRYVADTWSRMDMAPRHRIGDMRGRTCIELEPCDVSELYRRGWHEPEVIEVLAADSVTKLYGVVYLPFDRKEGDKFPVISSVYPGPQVDLVPQEFIPDDNGNQSLAQLGFVVINFAYRGSGPWRGRDFHTFGYGNLRDYALADDMAVIRQIAERYPCADIERVGIYGHSGGGFMTVAAMLNHPEFYKVGVAASGNHDNNIYSQWWGETFHGVQQRVDDEGRTRFESRIPTNIELADRLEGDLLLITGDVDNNVHPASTYRMAHALIRADKVFDMMVIPGADHGVGGRYYDNLIRRYFVRHLIAPDSPNRKNDCPKSAETTSEETK